MLNFLHNRASKIGVLIVAFFAFNILVATLAPAHPEGDSLVQISVLEDIADAESCHEKAFNNQVAICGMMSCLLTVETHFGVATVGDFSEVAFATLSDQLEGLPLDPPEHPPQV